MTTMKLNVNGETREVAVEPRMTLLEALRYGCGLTGAKPTLIERDNHIPELGVLLAEANQAQAMLDRLPQAKPAASGPHRAPV